MCVCVCVLCCLLCGQTSMHVHMPRMTDQFYIAIVPSHFCLGCLWQQQQQRRICLSKRSEKSNGDYDCISEVSMLVDFFVYLFHSLTEKSP